VDRYVSTDTLCNYFSGPLFIGVFLLFFIVLIFGRELSYLHPPDIHGFRCGINNSKFKNSFPDFTNKKYLGFNKSLQCMEHCESNTLISLCIPSNLKSLKKSPIYFRIGYDFLQYRSLLVFFVVFSVLFSLPLIFSCFWCALPVFYTICGVFSIFIIGGFGWYLYQGEYLISLCLFLFLSVFIIFFVFLKKRISVLYPIVSYSIKALLSSPSSLLSFLVILIAGLFSIVFGISGIIFTKGISDPVVHEKSLSIEQHPSLNLTLILFLFISSWFYEFVLAWMRMGISYIVASVFYRHPTPSFWDSMKTIIQFHSGTLFFGSYVVFALETLSRILLSVQSLLKKTKNTFIRFLFHCVLSIFYCFLKIAGEINRLSFVFTALKGFSFWDSCKESMHFYKNLDIMSIELLLHDVFLIAKVFMAGSSCICAWIVLSNKALELWVPITILPLIVYTIIGSVESTIESAAETVLVCIKEEADDDEVYTPRELYPIAQLFTKTDSL